jgi:hypothetical protein
MLFHFVDSLWGLLEPRSEVKPIIQSAATLSDNLCRNARDDSHGRNVFGHDTVRSNDRPSPDPPAGENRYTGSDPSVIFNDYVTSFVGMRVAVHIVFQGPNIGFLSNVYVISNHQPSAPTIQQDISVDHDAIPDKHVAAVSQLHTHE